MPFHRIQQARPWLGRTEADALAACIDRHWLHEGPAAGAFRLSLGQITGAPHVALAPNGMLGLLLALLALDLPAGGEVVMPGFASMAPASAVLMAGLRPVLVDVDPHTFTARPEAFERALGPRTVALMPAHLHGQAAQAAELAQVGRRLGLPVIEHAAHGCGVRYRQQHAGTFGDIGVLEFGPDGALSIGEGAALLCADQRLARRISLLRSLGSESDESPARELVGLNLRVTDLQCAVGQAQITRLPQIRTERQRRFQMYMEGLSGVRPLRFMKIDPHSECIAPSFPVLCPRAAELRHALEHEGVQTRPMFLPLHRQPALRERVDAADLPMCDTLHGEGLLLPMHAGLQDSDVHHVIDVIHRTLGRRATG